MFIFVQNLVHVIDNLYNPQNEAAYNTLDMKNGVNLYLCMYNMCMYVCATHLF